MSYLCREINTYRSLSIRRKINQGTSGHHYQRIYFVVYVVCRLVKKKKNKFAFLSKCKGVGV